MILKNYGQTPAYEVHFWHAVFYKELPLTSELIRPKEIPSQTKTVLNPGQEIELVLRINRPMTEEEKNAILARTNALYAYGEIYYRDAFKKARTSKLRMYSEAFQAGDGVFRGMRWADEGNEAD